MRTSPLVGLALLLGACTPLNYGVDTDDTAEDTGDTDTNDTEDSDTQVDASDCHAADPLALTGWTRNYSITWDGKSGTEVHKGLGAAYDSRGNAAFEVKIDLATQDGDTLTTREFRSCNAQGGATWHESRVEGQATFDLFGDMGGDFGDMAQLIALLTQLLGSSSGGTGGATGMPVNYRKMPTPGVPYLTDVAGLSSGTALAYDYELETTGQTADLMTIPNCPAPSEGTCVGVDGQITPLGLTSVTVAAGTFQAYRILDERTERWSEASSAGNTGLPDLSQLFPGMPGFGFGNTTDQELISELYYVPGIGLVKERTKYATAGSDDWLWVRELTSFSGLTATP